MERQQWRPWLVGVIGLWVIASPYLLGVPFVDEARAGAFRWSFVGPGALAVLLSIGALTAHQSWETGLAGAVGLWLILTPSMVGFIDTPSAVLSAVASGMAMVALAAWSIMSDLAKPTD
jgi:hypothetical protein